MLSVPQFAPLPIGWEDSGVARGYVLAVGAYDARGGSSILRSRRVSTSPCADSRKSARPPAAAPCSKTIGVGTGLAAAIAAAHAGSVVCLGSGNYGSVTLTSLRRTADVTVQPAAAATVTIGRVTLDLVRHLRFTGIGGTHDDPGRCDRPVRQRAELFEQCDARSHRLLIRVQRRGALRQT